MNGDTGSLRERLRDATAPSHDALEKNLGFDRNPSRALATRMLLGFHRALSVLEPALAELVPGAFAGRGKLGLLVDNLLELGFSRASLETPSRPAMSWMPRSQPEALGVMYVLEGSTLGGKVISKALRQVPDWPLAEHSYFNPYGANTGSQWLGFQSILAGVPRDQDREVIEGARRTFDMLIAEMKIESARP